MTNELWALGQYERIAALVQDMGPELVAAAGVGPGQRVLDVAAGTGNATLPAAAAGADVIATDITPELLTVGERAARAHGLDVRWQHADAQQLPFADGEFDVVLSCIGAMFAPDHRATARELLRVVRPGGVVAVANWTPDGTAGRFFRLLVRYAPEAPDGPAPTAWGDPRYVAELLGAEVTSARRRVRLRFDGPPEDLVAYYKRWFGPVIATYAGLDAERAAELDREMCELFAAEDRGHPGGPSRYELEYLLAVARPAMTSDGRAAIARGAAPA